MFRSIMGFNFQWLLLRCRNGTAACIADHANITKTDRFKGCGFQTLIDLSKAVRNVLKTVAPTQILKHVAGN